LAREEVGDTVQWGGGRWNRLGKMKDGDLVHWMEDGKTVM